MTITINEDAPYTFTTADFGFTDLNDSPANGLHAVKITTLPGAGILTLNGTPVNAGDSSTLTPAGVSWTAHESSRNWNAVASSADGTKLVAAAYTDHLYTSVPELGLVFTPAVNANGTPYTSFMFQVQDDDGTANGGVDLDPMPNTITFNVTASGPSATFGSLAAQPVAGTVAVPTLSLPSEVVVDELATTVVTAASSLDLVTNLASFRLDPRFQLFDGHGMTAVVIDTGIDVDHPFFGPDADHNGVAERIVFQWDFADNDADASDRVGHGSHIASLIGSEDLVYPGVAPEADLIALKVFSDAGTGSRAGVTVGRGPRRGLQHRRRELVAGRRPELDDARLALWAGR